MKRLMTLCAVALLTAPLVATPARPAQSDPDKLVKGSGTLPAGWKARMDSGSTKIDGVNVMAMGGGLHFTTGPAGIFYKPEAKGTGTYEVHATFTQMTPAEHPEAYGLIIGGSNLDLPTQKYTYFVLRQDGMFLLKRRDGTATPTVTNWTPHAAVKKADAAGKMVNVLAIQVAKDAVHFLVNGKEVSSAPRAQVDTDGIAGVRINHNLSVMVENFGVTPRP